MSMTLEQLEQQISELQKQTPQNIRNVTPSKQDVIFAELDKDTAQPQFEEDWFRALMPTRADLPIAVAGIGAGSSEAIAEFIHDLVFKDKTEVLGLQVITASRLVGGYLGYKLGSRIHPLASSFFGGVLIDAIGDIAEEKGWILKPNTKTTRHRGFHPSRIPVQSDSGSQTGNPWVQAAARAMM